MNNVLSIDLIYFIVALALSYELAFIIRQCREQHTIANHGLRISAAMVGSIILYKAVSRIGGGDTAEWIDVGREVSWAAFLLSAIFLLKLNRGWW